MCNITYRKRYIIFSYSADISKSLKRRGNIWQGSKAKPPQQLLSFRILSEGWGIGNLFFAIKGACSLPHSWISTLCYTSANRQEHPSWNNCFSIWTLNSVWVTKPSVCHFSLTNKNPRKNFTAFPGSALISFGNCSKQSTNLAFGFFFFFCSSVWLGFFHYYSFGEEMLQRDR